ncbi:MAG: VCBS repeat-containing protein [Bacteroidetes bacterium]|nr:VCBS repeat-containing protein [Bacteroidota bacterium]MDA1121951.1 VCBS repeat-containing protein [Bacteroidota bacterium]
MTLWLAKKNEVVTVLLATASCGRSDDPSDPDDDPDDDPTVQNRIPQEVYDQESYTASYMLDTDQDGDDDIILGPAQGPASDMLLLNDGNGFFELKLNAFPARYQGSNGQTVNITSGDFNNDGRTDIIASTIDGRDATFSRSAQIHL